MITQGILYKNCQNGRNVRAYLQKQSDVYEIVEYIDEYDTLNQHKKSTPRCSNFLKVRSLAFILPYKKYGRNI